MPLHNTYSCVHVYIFSCIQVSGESPPAPTRGPSVANDEGEEEGEGGEGGEGGGGGAAAQAPVSLADMMPKVDISGQIKPNLISEFGDKNWKVRGEALQQVCTCTCTCMCTCVYTCTCWMWVYMCMCLCA